MQETSQLYKDILAGDRYSFETSVVIGDTSRLVDNSGDVILFGGDAILTDSGGAESGFQGDSLFSVETNSEFFADGEPGVGAAVSGEVDISMVAPYNVPRKASIRLFIRAKNDTQVSEWVPQGVYYIDTREQTQTGGSFEILTIHGYDAMLLSEITYPSDDSHDYPLLDQEMVQFIADNMDVQVDSRTFALMDMGYTFPLPVGYSMREVLGMIAAAYAGNFVITQTGELRLVTMFDLPAETRHLITEDGYKITFGDDYILV